MLVFGIIRLDLSPKNDPPFSAIAQKVGLPYEVPTSRSN